MNHFYAFFSQKKKKNSHRSFIIYSFVDLLFELNLKYSMQILGTYR